MIKNKVVLIILDGFGLNPSKVYNGISMAKTPHLDYYFATNSHTAIEASGEFVGLPDGQFGNSEVGHLTMGSGRTLKQDMLRISHALESGEFKQNEAWHNFTKNAKKIHLIGMVSDGGVHSDINHLINIIKILKEANTPAIIHMITDGRDRPPQSGLCYARFLEDSLKNIKWGEIATVSGRYYAMDRIGNFEKTKKAWQAMALGNGLVANTLQDAIKNAYLRGETDEFIQATVIKKFEKKEMDIHDKIFFFNFRADRMRQIVSAFGLESFKGFERNTFGIRDVLCMTEYDETFKLPVVFKPEIPKNTLAEVLSNTKLKQFHCAEKEKYAHVTYFFNGGIEKPFSDEDRKIVSSPDVETYDLKPEMSAKGVADSVINVIRTQRYDFLVVNFANGDMVGHTAVKDAIIKAVETLDLESHRIVETALNNNYKVVLTADHGNCEEMVDPETGEPNTQHTCYPVPFLLMGVKGVRLGIGRGLADVAPTILDIMGLKKPKEMNGKTLIIQGNIC